jgi:hypothetical protein
MAAQQARHRRNGEIGGGIGGGVAAQRWRSVWRRSISVAWRGGNVTKGGIGGGWRRRRNGGGVAERRHGDVK